MTAYEMRISDWSSDVCSSDLLTEAFDGGENIVGGFDPFVGFGVFVVHLDEGGDVGFEFRGGAMDTALQLLARQLSKPPFNLVDPGRRCRCEMHMPMRADRKSTRLNSSH